MFLTRAYYKNLIDRLSQQEGELVKLRSDLHYYDAHFDYKVKQGKARHINALDEFLSTDEEEEKEVIDLEITRLFNKVTVIEQELEGLRRLLATKENELKCPANKIATGTLNAMEVNLCNVSTAEKVIIGNNYSKITMYPDKITINWGKE